MQAHWNGPCSSPIAAILSGVKNKCQKFAGLIAFLAMEVCCSTEMERVAGSDQKKSCFLANQLIGPANILN
jgi:hypothetical protein